MKPLNMLKGDYKFRLGISFYRDSGFITPGRGEHIDSASTAAAKTLRNSDIM